MKVHARNPPSQVVTRPGTQLLWQPVGCGRWQSVHTPTLRFCYASRPTESHSERTASGQTCLEITSVGRPHQAADANLSALLRAARPAGSRPDSAHLKGARPMKSLNVQFNSIQITVFFLLGTSHFEEQQGVSIPYSTYNKQSHPHTRTHTHTISPH